MASYLKKSKGEILFDIFNYLFLTILVLVTLYPFYHVVVASFSQPSLLVKANGLLLHPLGFSREAYKMVFANKNIISGYLNTLFLVTVGTTINLILTSFGAYGLSRKKLPGKTFIMLAIVFTMFLRGGMIPRFLLVGKLGLLDTRWALILPVAINTWNLIIMRTVFQAIPVSLEESARLDGANDFTILFHIYIPVAIPVIAVMILFYSVYHWNSYFNALIYLQTRALYPLQLILREILIIGDTDTMARGIVTEREPVGQTIKYATIVVSTLPILTVYPFLQKYFVKGVMVGSVKG